MLKIGWILCLLFFLSVGCSHDAGEKPIPPVLESTNPVDGAEEVPINAEVSVTFDEVVHINEKVAITVNGIPVSANASFRKVILNTELEYGTHYTVIVPPGAVINTLDVPSKNEIRFSFTTQAPVIIKEKLAVSNPSPEAQNVYNFLKEIYGTSIISATMANVNWNINEAEWVRLHTGKYPAMANFDYIHLPYSPSNWIDYSNTQIVEEWWQNKGLVGACWHWLVPVSQGATEYTYRPSETSFRAANATVEGTWENEVLNADLNKVAGYLKLLSDKNIPVIWRPLHEAAGNIYEYNDGTAWFWWGYDGAEAFKKLWIYMFNYFEAQGLNNLIWVWTTQTNDEDFYPGDDYVDIIGRDIYDVSDVSVISAQFETIQTDYPDKIITLSEMGGVPHISDQWASLAKWSWFMPWYDYERTNNPNSANFNGTDHEFADIAWWQNAFNDDAVISRDEMPDLKQH
ncbi:glycosyl hydrolase [Thermophagus xiamenensis]|uniref:Mannan endo-1,4-beta-mannosidase n=1 Tax=Thermophagus xiamenensis TaxID=385682 RepID=A0A1I1ZEZ2_9BACT|nr:glycosyl hydrolase [Thermophagus xiamenensis]SFE30255.1 mannan endo-1,4-beta-mannosidase [Thermophagus xiamenensis]